MASENERWLSHFDLQLHAKGKLGEVFKLESALKNLEVAAVAGTATVVEVDDRWILQLADIQVGKKTAVLLFLGIDKLRAPAIYGNIKTLTLRAIRKAADEGVAVSAHLATSLEPDVKHGCYNAVLEEVEGLSRTKLVPYLQRMLNKQNSFFVHQEDGTQEPVESVLASSVVLDAPIQVQLNEAKLLSVQAVRKTAAKSIDKNHEFFEKTRLIEFRPTWPSSGDAARNVLRSILRQVNKDEYPEVRIRVEENEGRERTVSIDRHRQSDPLASAFQLRTLVAGITPPLPEASKEILSHLADKMVKVIK